MKNKRGIPITWREFLELEGRPHKLSYSIGYFGICREREGGKLTTTTIKPRGQRGFNYLFPPYLRKNSWEGQGELGERQHQY